MPLVTEAELGRLLKRDRSAIHYAVKAGRVTRRPDGLFDRDAAIAEFMATTDLEKGHNNRTRAALPEIPAPDIPSVTDVKSTAYAKARAGEKIYDALNKKLRYEERAKNLTPTADVESARYTEFRTLRDACFNIPARIAPLLAGQPDVAKCQTMLEAELTTVFQAFADGTLDGKLAA